MLFGNIIGSNIVNVLLIMGIGALISPIIVPQSLRNYAIPLLCVSTALLGLVLSRRWKLWHWVGGVFVTLYVAFLWLAWIS